MNPRGLWLYLSDASRIIKQWEEIEEEKIKNWKCEIWSKVKKKITRKINNNLNNRMYMESVKCHKKMYLAKKKMHNQ